MSRLLILSCITLSMFSSHLFADLKELANANDFDKAIKEAQVPVIVQFSAYWCKPCQNLKKTLAEATQNYNDNQILFYYVDAYVNASLKEYLNGGYPTTRVFSQGKMGAHFVGSKSSDYVRSFIDETIKQGAIVKKENSLIELESLEAFNKMITTSEMPVIVQFSAHWCKPCQRLKAKMKTMAPLYNANDIKICYVDAYVISELKIHLEGGYPTTKVFRKGKVGKDFFVGNVAEHKLKKFIDDTLNIDASAVNSLIEFETAEEFELAIKSSNVPVVVQFSAHWCKPCQRLKEKMKNIVVDYSQDKVQVCYVDAHVNTSLKKYLDGGYPTVRVFSNGKLTKNSFVGNKSESYLRNFLDQLTKEEK